MKPSSEEFACGFIYPIARSIEHLFSLDLFAVEFFNPDQKCLAQNIGPVLSNYRVPDVIQSLLSKSKV